VSLKRRVQPLAEHALDVAWRPVKRRRFEAAFADLSRQGPVKINLGSGGRPITGWLNCDVTWRGETYLDATQPWPVPGGSVGFVYADNVIEHITLEGGAHVFRNAFAALAPGAVFRLATPDVEAIARQYLENGELAQLGLEQHRARGRDLHYPVQLLTQAYVGAKHYLGFLYDYESLGTEMERAGFEVRRVQPSESDHPELRGLEARLTPAEVATSLVVEGTRP
jgi:predicted SAM-dependent methyltransferase